MDELERMVRAGEYLRATRYFEEVVKPAKFTTGDLATAYHWTSIAQYQLRNIFAARTCAVKAAELAERAGDTLVLLKAWMNLVDIENLAGAPLDALSYGRRWLTKAAIEAPHIEIKWSGRVHYNMALAHKHRRDYDATIRHLDLSLPSLRQHDSVSAVIACLQMSAWLRYEMGRTAEADAHVADIEGVLDFAPDDLEARIEQLLLHAWRAYWSEDFAESTRLAEELLHNPNLAPLQRFWAPWLMAAAAVKVQPLTPDMSTILRDSAIMFAELALDAATKTARSDLINRANTLRREANDLTTDAASEAG